MGAHSPVIARSSAPYTFPAPPPFDKKALRAQPQPITADSIDSLRGGRFSYTTENAVYEGFLQPSDTRRLYVLLSAAGRSDGSLQFSRVSWGPALNGVTLNIEDPMYASMPGLWGGWYYGTKDISHLNEIADFVREFARLRGIAPDDIMFVGSSAAGYAALFLAAAVAGSTAFAMNPQIELARGHYARRFEQMTGIDFKAEDPLGRNNLRYIAKNRTSRFVITCNLLSTKDYDVHIKPWLAEEGVEPEGSDQPRLIHHGNMTIILHKTPAPNLHHTFPDIEHFAAMLPSIMSGYPIRADKMLPVFTSLRHKLQTGSALQRLNLWIDLLGKLQAPGLFRFETDKASYLRLMPEHTPRGYAYRIEADESFTAFAVLIVAPHVGQLANDPARARLAGIAEQLGGKLIDHPRRSIVKVGRLARGDLEAAAMRIIATAQEAVEPLLSDAASNP